MKHSDVTISKEKLIAYFVRTCPDRRCGGFGDDNSYCHALMDKECKAMFVNPQECPWDCPHILTVSTRCTGEKCKKIKKMIKEIIE